MIFHLRGTVSQALASLTKLLEDNNFTIVAQELLGDSKEEIHESPIKILKVGSTRPVLISGFSSIKRRRAFLLLSAWDAIPPQDYPLIF